MKESSVTNGSAAFEVEHKKSAMENALPKPGFIE